ncbi:unnamed protein product [Rotaria sp. Silwood2]|nr:unnamed protein product [Rotaria sp. Silwood2]CAF4301165.1 unnamed protein product [Rotaria sp. Silwood2]
MVKIFIIVVVHYKLIFDFSKLHSLNVKYKHDKSRDDANPILLPSEDSNEPISIDARYLTDIPNIYGSPIMTLTEAPLTTPSAINNASTATLLNVSQLAQQYTTAVACQVLNRTNPTTTLLTTTGTTQSPSSLSTLQQPYHQHAQIISPYITSSFRIIIC